MIDIISKFGLDKCRQHLKRVGCSARCIELLENQNKTKALEATNDFFDKRKTFLILGGGVGCGKTTAACFGFLRHQKKCQGYDGNGGVTSFDVPDEDALFIRAASVTSQNHWENPKLYQTLHRVGLLVLDDLGAERDDKSGIWLEQFDLIIDFRYAERKKTIITTNLTGQILATRYGARVMDRLKHDGEFVNCGASSMRKHLNP